jgi:hypothetical protein
VLLELGHADSRKSRSGVMLSSVMMDLVNGDSGVDDMGLDSLLLYYRLNCLMDVMVDVFSSNRWCGG